MKDLFGILTVVIIVSSLAGLGFLAGAIIIEIVSILDR